MLDGLKKKAKKISKDMVLINVAIVLLGLFLVLKPGEAREIICTFIGGILTAWGGFKLFDYFLTRRKTDLSMLSLIGGCILLAVGASIIIAPVILAGMITAALAVILFIGAVFKLQYGVAFMQNESKLWWLQTVGAILMIITSVIAIINPFGSAGNLIMIFIGFALMADGIWDLLSILYISKVLKKAVKKVEEAEEYSYSSDSSSSGRYIETTAEDVSSEQL